MKILTENTLADIAKHSDKVIKLSKFMIQANQPFLFSDMTGISKESSPIDAIEAFHNDVNKTTSHLQKAFALLSSVNDDDEVIHLKNEEKNLKTLFGNNYNPLLKVIDFGTCQLSLKSNFDKDSMSRQIIKSTIGLDYDQYATMNKGRKKIFKLSEGNLLDDAEKITFLSVVKDQDKYKDVIKKIKELGLEYGNYRSKTSLHNKIKIDNEITFNRSMIDSVTKQSTYITKDDGIIQLAKDHKASPTEIEIIHEFIKDSPHVSAVELDQDTSLASFINLLNQVKNIKFNLANEIVFKVRKLGNYNANGLYLDSQKIVSVDVNKPSAAIHELIHAVDFSNPDIVSSPQRSDLIKKFRKHIDAESLPEGKSGYYLSGVEIVARLGEVSYLLNKFDYKETESVEEFASRVSTLERSENPNELNLTKPIKTYINNMANEYFNLTMIPREDLIEAKEFYKSFMGVDGQEIVPISTISIKHEPVSYTGRKQQLRHIQTPVSLFNSKNIKFALDFNFENKVVDFDLFIGELCSNISQIGRTKKKYLVSELNDQGLTLGAIADWSFENDEPYITYLLLDNLYKLDKDFDSASSLSFKYATTNDIQISYKDNESKYVDIILDLEKSIAEHNNTIIEEHKKTPINIEYADTIRAARRGDMKDLAKFTNKGRREFSARLNELIPEIPEINVDRRSSLTMPDEYKAKVLADVKEKLVNNIKHFGLEAILKHTTRDSILPYAIMGDDKFGSYIGEGIVRDNFQNTLPIFYKLGILDNLNKNQDSFIETFKIIRKRNARYDAPIEVEPVIFAVKKLIDNGFSQDLKDMNALTNDPDFIDALKDIDVTQKIALEKFSETDTYVVNIDDVSVLKDPDEEKVPSPKTSSDFGLAQFKLF